MVLGLPFVERRAADPVFAANVPGLRSGFLLTQHRNNPLFREPRLLHIRLPLKVTDSSHFWRRFRGSGQSGQPPPVTLDQNRSNPPKIHEQNARNTPVVQVAATPETSPEPIIAVVPAVEPS